ncbi:MAG TPA: diguanylate cyclase [Gaiellaceae bacterium]|nr:diguanylate cyclase [Gaiellaceae bacterium]
MEETAAKRPRGGRQASDSGSGSSTHLPAPAAHATKRVLHVAVPVIVAGAFATVSAAVSLARGGVDLELAAGLLALLVASAVAEAFPLPLEPAGEVTLGAVFVVGAAATYGWEAAALFAFATALVDLVERKPTIRVAYNGANYALSGLAAGLAAGLGTHGPPVAALTLEVLAAAVAFNVVNIALNGAVIARWTGDRFVDVVRESTRTTWAPIAIMASVSLMLAVLWEQSPLLIGALVGPLIAIALYQRSVHKAIRAMRLALTDAQTGLGNKRQFEELLQRSLDRADETGEPLTLCLIDLDDFKAINDTYGHPAGDRVLAQVAARLRRGGESFRLGGDEFAILLPGHTTAEGRQVAQAVSRRIAEAKYDHGGSVSISIGVATYPADGVGRAELVRVADKALYSAKGAGKARVRMYRPDATAASPGPGLAGRAAGLRAAASAANAVIERDVYIGAHSRNVGELAARIAERLGLDAEEVELVRVAGNLHDIGKLLVPEDVLHKPGPLTPAERSVVERHATIGRRMLEALGLEPIATWVQHHHERWDGQGYPAGLAREEIPLPSRVLFVADAFDTMTTDRVYRTKVTRAEALAEIERRAGAQFDPAVVAALREELVDPPLELVLPATA